MYRWLHSSHHFLFSSHLPAPPQKNTVQEGEVFGGSRSSQLASEMLIFISPAPVQIALCLGIWLSLLEVINHRALVSRVCITNMNELFNFYLVISPDPKKLLSLTEILTSSHRLILDYLKRCSGWSIVYQRDPFSLHFSIRHLEGKLFTCVDSGLPGEELVITTERKFRYADNSSVS